MTYKVHNVCHMILVIVIIKYCLNFVINKCTVNAVSIDCTKAFVWLCYMQTCIYTIIIIIVIVIIIIIIIIIIKSFIIGKNNLLKNRAQIISIITILFEYRYFWGYSVISGNMQHIQYYTLSDIR